MYVREGRTILIDDIDGHARVAYGRFPDLICKNLMKRNLRVLFRRPHPTLPDMNC